MFLPKHRSPLDTKDHQKMKPICHPRRLKAIKKIYIQIKYHILNLFYTDGSNFSDLVGLCLSDQTSSESFCFPNFNCQHRAVNFTTLDPSVFPLGLESSSFESFKVPYSFLILAASSLVLSVSSWLFSDGTVIRLYTVITLFHVLIPSVEINFIEKV